MRQLRRELYKDLSGVCGVVKFSGIGSLGSANGVRFERCGRGEALGKEYLNLSATKFLRHWLLCVVMCGVAATQFGN